MASRCPNLLDAPRASIRQQQQAFTEHLPGTIIYKALLGQGLHEPAVLLCVNQKLLILQADVAQDLASDKHPFIEKKALFLPTSDVDF